MKRDFIRLANLIYCPNRYDKFGNHKERGNLAQEEPTTKETCTQTLHTFSVQYTCYTNIPGPGRKFLKGSSALIRHSIECPWSTISSCKWKKTQQKLKKNGLCWVFIFILPLKISLSRYLFVAEFSSHCNMNLFLNQVNRGNHFCHRMLNLSFSQKGKMIFSRCYK